LAFKHVTQPLIPSSDTFLSSHYNIQLILEEVLVAKSFLSTKGPEAIPDILSVFMILDPMIFLSLKVILQVAITIPVSSCSCEPTTYLVEAHHGPAENQ